LTKHELFSDLKLEGCCQKLKLGQIIMDEHKRMVWVSGDKILNTWAQSGA